MGLNKQKGNMYPFVTHTWNPIRGKCPHDCIYCYMKAYPQGEYRFVETELKTNLGKDNFIFVGSSTDMWLAPSHQLVAILEYCGEFNNRYLFQSKAPRRFTEYKFPANTLLGTTIETNRFYEGISKAPPTGHRVAWMKELALPKMVSIEPIMDFDLPYLLDWIKQITPEFVSIGADSKGHNLPEPSWDKVSLLVDKLKRFTEVKLKDNLKRLEYRQEMPNV